VSVSDRDLSRLGRAPPRTYAGTPLPVSKEPVFVPVRLFTDAERERLNRFPRDISPADVLAFFTLSDDELELIGDRRGAEVSRAAALADALAIVRGVYQAPAPRPLKVTLLGVWRPSPTARATLLLYASLPADRLVGLDWTRVQSDNLATLGVVRWLPSGVCQVLASLRRRPRLTGSSVLIVVSPASPFGDPAGRACPHNGRDDHVLLTVQNVEIPILVKATYIAAPQVHTPAFVAPHRLCRLLRLLVVATHQERRISDDFPNFAAREFLSLIVDDANVPPQSRDADGADLLTHHRSRQDRGEPLGQPVCLDQVAAAS